MTTEWRYLREIVWLRRELGLNRDELRELGEAAVELTTLQPEPIGSLVRVEKRLGSEEEWDGPLASSRSNGARDQRRLVGVHIREWQGPKSDRALPVWKGSTVERTKASMSNGDRFLINYSEAARAVSILVDIAERDARRARNGEAPWDGGPTYKELQTAASEALRSMYAEYCAATGYSPSAHAFDEA